MLYLKNTLGGLGRSLHDSALNTFQGPNRWWKLALYVVMFVLPGGSLGVLFFAWIDNRRNARAAAARKHAPSAAPVALLTGVAVTKAAASAARAASSIAKVATPIAKAAVPALAAPTGCQPRADAPPCRAAAGKQARQTTADARC